MPALYIPDELLPPPRLGDKPLTLYSAVCLLAIVLVCVGVWWLAVIGLCDVLRRIW